MTNIEQSNEKRQRSQAITQTEWEQYMAEKILRLIRHELYMDFRYMDVALSALSYQPKEGIDTLGTEGDHLFYSADHLLRVYPKNPVYFKPLLSSHDPAFDLLSSVAAGQQKCSRLGSGV